MDVFITEDNRTYVAVDLAIPKDKVLTAANKHFKINKAQLSCGNGWVKNDTLYFEETRGAKKVWLVYRTPKK